MILKSFRMSCQQFYPTFMMTVHSLKMRMPRDILNKEVISGASVIDGIIHGGINNGESLFE